MRPTDIKATHSAIRAVCARHATTRDEAEDFRSWAQVRLLENYGELMRKFEGRSKLSTYLITIVTRLFLDYRRAKWSRWRPSAPAKRLGAVAIQLETLVYRDGHPFDDAVVMLRERMQVQASDAELEELFGKLPHRTKRRFESDDGLERLAAPSDPEGEAVASERAASAQDVSSRLTSALGTLEPQDALVLRLRFAEGMKVVDIARRLGLEQRKLYGRIEKMLRTLKQAILECGISEDQVRDLLGWDELALDVDFGGGRDGGATSAREHGIDFSEEATAQADGSGSAESGRTER